MRGGDAMRKIRQTVEAMWQINIGPSADYRCRIVLNQPSGPWPRRVSVEGPRARQATYVRCWLGPDFL